MQIWSLINHRYWILIDKWYIYWFIYVLVCLSSIFIYIYIYLLLYCVYFYLSISLYLSLFRISFLLVNLHKLTLSAMSYLTLPSPTCWPYPHRQKKVIDHMLDLFFSLPSFHPRTTQIIFNLCFWSGCVKRPPYYTTKKHVDYWITFFFAREGDIYPASVICRFACHSGFSTPNSFSITITNSGTVLKIPIKELRVP